MKVKKEELKDVAQRALKALPDVEGRATVMWLSGTLGAGKTAFTQALAKELGVREAVQSPTFVLMKSYPLPSGRFDKLVHIDAYRLESPDEFSALKPDAFLRDERALVVVEWPERAEARLPAPDLRLKFSSDGAHSDERYIEGI